METEQKGRAIPFVLYSNKRFIITDEARDLFSNQYKNNSIGIISLVGKYRTGKSFLLNRVLLNQRKENGFDVGPTIKACTKGIWMWTEPRWIENSHSLEKFPVFMIDTEGLGAYDEEINHDTKIFLIAILISSLFIYNSFGNIDENSINSLSFILHLSKTIKISENSHKFSNKYEINSELAKYFPCLLWLLRDFSLKLEDSEGNAITANQYLENALNVQKGNSNVIEEKNKVRRMITTYFPDRDCYSMVRPVENEVDLQNLQSLDDSEIRKEFLEQATALRDRVFNKVKPKLFNGKILSGNMLIELLASILDSINQGAIPVIESTWKYIVQSESNKNITEIITEYIRKINRFKEENSSKLTFFADFENFRKNLEKYLIGEFQKTSISDESSQIDYIMKLKSKFEDESKKFNEENTKFFEKKLTENLDENLKIILEGLDSSKYSKNHFQFFHDLENAKEATEASTPDFPSKNEKIFEKIILTIKKFIEGTFVKNKLQNEKEIITLKNDLQTMNNKFNLKCEELQFQQEEFNHINENLSNQIVDYKLLEKSLEEKLKETEIEKRNFYASAEKKLFDINKDYQNRIETISKEKKKSEEELKAREEEILNMQITEKKMTALNEQKIQFMEKEISTHKERSEGLRKDNLEYRKTIDELIAKMDELKTENNKKQYIEAEMERMKKEYNNNFGIGEQTDNNEYTTERYSHSSRMRHSISLNNTNTELLSVLRNHITSNKNQFEEMKAMYGNILNSLKMSQSNVMNQVTHVNVSDTNVNSNVEAKKNLSETIQNVQLKYLRFKEKNCELKKFLNNCDSIKCKNCAELFSLDEYKSHLIACFDDLRAHTSVQKKKEKYKIKILKGIPKYDNSRIRKTYKKQNFEFEIEVYYNYKKWIIYKDLSEVENLRSNVLKDHRNIKLDQFNYNFENSLLPESPEENIHQFTTSSELHLRNFLILEKFFNFLLHKFEIRTSKTLQYFIEYDENIEINLDGHSDLLDTNELADKNDKDLTHIKKFSEYNILDKEKTLINEFNFIENSNKCEYQTLDLKTSNEFTRLISENSARKDSNVSQTDNPVNPFNTANLKTSKCDSDKIYKTVTSKENSRIKLKPSKKILVRNNKKSCSVDYNGKTDKDGFISSAINQAKLKDKDRDKPKKPVIVKVTPAKVNVIKIGRIINNKPNLVTTNSNENKKHF